MLSVIVYGRNDAHGYNLHKRAAVSINCIAALLTGNDEIVFVDYNTADELPTFPEAIQDTLTPAARDRLQILRIRDVHHARFAPHTHLRALEPVARNVAVRRCNPSNRWVLSTNTDMIFVPHVAGRTFADLLVDVPDGFYQLPRFELPECLWESFDRFDPAATIAQTRAWGEAFCLNEIVYSGPVAVYDAPGDFQLALRTDLIALDAFDERMLLGWHVDANLAKRMALHRGSVRTFADRLAGYHCDHTRVATVLHGVERTENDWSTFIEHVDDAAIPAQSGSWGLNGVPIEEIRLGAATAERYIAALGAAICPRAITTAVSCDSSTHNDLRYDRHHVLPFAFDAIASLPAGLRIGYAGAREDTLTAFAAGVEIMLPGSVIVVPPGFAGNEGGGWAVSDDSANWIADIDAAIFEIGAPDGDHDEDYRHHARRSGRVIGLFLQLVRRRRGTRPMRIVAINAINNSFEQYVGRYLRSAITPFSSRTRHGFLAGTADLDDLGFWRRWLSPAPDGDAWADERAAMLACADEVYPIADGSPDRRALIVSPEPDRLALLLAQIGPAVDIADPRQLASLGHGRDWRETLASAPTLVPDALGLVQRGRAYDLVIVPRAGLDPWPAEARRRVLTALSQSLATGGMLVTASSDESRGNADPLCGGVVLQKEQGASHSANGEPFYLSIYRRVGDSARLPNDALPTIPHKRSRLIAHLGALAAGSHAVTARIEVGGLVPTEPSLMIRLTAAGRTLFSRPCLRIEIERRDVRQLFDLESAADDVIVEIVAEPPLSVISIAAHTAPCPV